jgi:diamine N-acetyltransferase
MKELHNQIRLEILDAANWRASLELEVRPEQQAFVAAYSPITAIMLAKAYVRAGGREWEPLAIVAGDQMIGALALSVGPEDRDQCWLFHYFIDRRYQARGYGKAGLQALFSYVRERRPDCRSLDLLVHPENLPAQALYRSAGFQPSGRVIEGELHYSKLFDHKKSPLEL